MVWLEYAWLIHPVGVAWCLAQAAPTAPLTRHTTAQSARVSGEGRMDAEWRLGMRLSGWSRWASRRAKMNLRHCGAERFSGVYPCAVNPYRQRGGVVQTRKGRNPGARRRLDRPSRNPSPRLSKDSCDTLSLVKGSFYVPLTSGWDPPPYAGCWMRVWGGSWPAPWSLLRCREVADWRTQPTLLLLQHALVLRPGSSSCDQVSSGKASKRANATVR